MTDTALKTCPSCFKDIDARALRCAYCAQRQGDGGLSRNVQGRVVAGVCASLAQHFNVDLTLMRVLFIGSLAITGGLAFWVYAAMWLMTPYEQGERAPLARLFDALGTLFSPRSTGVDRVE